MKTQLFVFVILAIVLTACGKSGQVGSAAQDANQGVTRVSGAPCGSHPSGTTWSDSKNDYSCQDGVTTSTFEG